jgi:hypothetical protein
LVYLFAVKGNTGDRVVCSGQNWQFYEGAHFGESCHRRKTLLSWPADRIVDWSNGIHRWLIELNTYVGNLSNWILNYMTDRIECLIIWLIELNAC